MDAFDFYRHNNLDPKDLIEFHSEVDEFIDSVYEDLELERPEIVILADLLTLAEKHEGLKAELEDTEWLDDYFDIHKVLSELEDVAQRGETLILEDNFTDYCQDLLSDIGDLPRDLPHYIVIDWEATADNIKADYSKIDIGTRSYLYLA